MKTFLDVLLTSLLVSCGQRQAIDSDYELRTPYAWNADGHPGTALFYKGKQIWPNVYGGGRAANEGIFVFISPVPTSEGEYDYSTSPQLFAVKGHGPVVLISERVLGGERSTKDYTVWGISQIEQGVLVKFGFFRDGKDQLITNSLSWSRIAEMLVEAENVAVRATPLGTFKLLPASPVLKSHSIQ